MRASRDILERQVGQLCRLVDDLLDVGRITSGKVLIQHVPALLQAVLDQAVEATRPQLEQMQHHLSLDLPDTALYVDGDHARLVQVVSNLLHNAAKFTQPRGKVMVSLSRCGDNAEISVRDNGPGIAPEDLKYVFGLFAQGGTDVSSRMQGGLGVGLSLVHQLVTAHGGQISAFSTGQATEGAEFIITLPLIPAPDEGYAGVSEVAVTG